MATFESESKSEILMDVQALTRVRKLNWVSSAVPSWNVCVEKSGENIIKARKTAKQLRLSGGKSQQWRNNNREGTPLLLRQNTSAINCLNNACCSFPASTSLFVLFCPAPLHANFNNLNSGNPSEQTDTEYQI